MQLSKFREINDNNMHFSTTERVTESKYLGIWLDKKMFPLKASL